MFSFKLRGAYNKMAHLTPAELARGVICSSAGNHAQGVALAAQKLVRQLCKSVYSAAFMQHPGWTCAESSHQLGSSALEIRVLGRHR